jgi:hypothetical protein
MSPSSAPPLARLPWADRVAAGVDHRAMFAASDGDFAEGAEGKPLPAMAYLWVLVIG